MFYSVLYLFAVTLSFWISISMGNELASIGLNVPTDDPLHFAEYVGFSQGYTLGHTLGFMSVTLPVLSVTCCQLLDWLTTDDNFSRIRRMFRREK
ncbi:MAG: hypothetical protein AB7U29_16545 [Desulfobulbus sp.]